MALILHSANYLIFAHQQRMWELTQKLVCARGFEKNFTKWKIKMEEREFRQELAKILQKGGMKP